MRIRAIKIRNVRNLVAVDVLPGRTLSIFIGGNGAGKTSLLEAVYMLARGRSFRGMRVAPLIRQGESELTVFGELVEESGGIRRVGVRKTNNGSTGRIDGTSVRALSELALAVPLVSVTPLSQTLLDGGPRIRRRLLDWGLFHVEPSIRESMHQYARALHQRNALLRKGSCALEPWELVLAEAGERLSRSRERYLDQLKPVFSALAAGFSGLPRVDLVFQQGWPRNQGLQQILKSRRVPDERVGHSMQGSHRDTFRLTAGGKPIQEMLSRGQQKLIVLSLLLAQGKLLAQQTDRKPVGLIDEFDAELDSSNARIAVETIRELDWQFLITSVKREFGHELKQSGAQLFHVEQGRITSM